MFWNLDDDFRWCTGLGSIGEDGGIGGSVTTTASGFGMVQSLMQAMMNSIGYPIMGGKD
jgi:hypothetical protein